MAAGAEALMGKPVAERDTTRLLMGPGPTNPFDSVLAVQSRPLLGHLDPSFVEIIEEAAAGLRALFGTKNAVTFAASGTGSSGMELLGTNLFEKGDVVVVGVNGVFGGRIRQLLERIGVEVVSVEKPFGEGFTAAEIEAAIKTEVTGKGKTLAGTWVVVAETSTGWRQDQMAEIAAATHAANEKALLLADCVTALGGLKLELDAWGVDAAFSGTQKCLGVPPCLAPVTLGERAMAKLDARTTPIPTWYFDLTQLLGYWKKPASGGKRSYHHTAPISSAYALHEGVRLLIEEGVDNVPVRYAKLGARLTDALTERGFKYVTESTANRLPQLHCVMPPDDVDEAKLRANLMNNEKIEIGNGLGALSGKVVRIGLMGANCNDATLDKFLAALDKWLPESKK